ncbi:MAG: PrsW family intramembrane metalloprotease [Microbacterium sp.]|nr:PrsW family intramembrane metalloprotease [Microbacterium sp.]
MTVRARAAFRCPRNVAERVWKDRGVHSAVVPPTFVARWIAPRGARSWTSSLLAVAWGAGAAVLLATGIGAWSAEQAMYVDDQGILREAMPTMWVLTPVVEEVGKGLGVLLILLLARRIGLRGVLFGAMVGALVGVGFAAVEVPPRSRRTSRRTISAPASRPGSSVP